MTQIRLAGLASRGGRRQDSTEEFSVFQCWNHWFNWRVLIFLRTKREDKQTQSSVRTLKKQRLQLVNTRLLYTSTSAVAPAQQILAQRGALVSFLSHTAPNVDTFILQEYYSDA